MTTSPFVPPDPTGTKIYLAATPGGSGTVNYSTPQDSLAILWGTIDPQTGRNVVMTFFDGGTVEDTINGIMALAALPGSVANVTNAEVAWITPSWHLRQAYFGRRVTTTRYCAGIMSSRCERSSPITCIGSPQQDQAVSSGSTTISDPRRMLGQRATDRPPLLGAGAPQHRIGLLLLRFGFGDCLFEVL
jgi:hypothetical protein